MIAFVIFENPRSMGSVGSTAIRNKNKRVSHINSAEHTVCKIASRKEYFLLLLEIKVSLATVSCMANDCITDGMTKRMVIADKICIVRESRSPKYIY